MKLCQRIILDSKKGVSTSLWGGPEKPDPEYLFERLCSPCELSFHPYVLEAFASCSKLWSQALPTPLIITWGVKIIDDDQHQPLYNNLSSNRCLLLLSETLLGMQEAIDAVGLRLARLEPEPSNNLLTFYLENKSNRSAGTLTGAALLLSTAFDSLLFVRGLVIKESTLELSQGQEKVDPELAQVLSDIFIV